MTTANFSADPDLESRLTDTQEYIRLLPVYMVVTNIFKNFTYLPGEADRKSGIFGGFYIQLYSPKW